MVGHTARVGEPEISVVIPTFQRQALLPELVRLLEGQSLPPSDFEVILVDNGSGDGTVELLTELAESSALDIQVLTYTERQGPAGARNAGWRQARSPVVAFTDDDCLPAPEWLAEGLAAVKRDERLGVVQGRTAYPEGSTLGDWSVYRQVDGPTPFFEGCNLFFRREALVQTAGFDEVAGFYFEDTQAGWAVVEAGWGRGYADGALVLHPVEDRGFLWHVRNGYVERNMVRAAARHPGFREEAMWRHWAQSPTMVRMLVALAGAAVGMRRPLALALVWPYVSEMRRTTAARHDARYLAERTVVDAARALGHLVGSVENRTLLL